MTNMKAEIKQKWLEALRSGRYEQGRGVLRSRADRFCCLGILCDLIDPSGWGGVHAVETNIDGHDKQIYAFPYKAGELVSDTSLPEEMRARTGLEFPDINALIEMNDSGCDFMKIARHIEANIQAD